MKRIRSGAAWALATFAVCACAAVLATALPAGAVPPNEILIARNLERLGLIPPYADAQMATAAARALGAAPPRGELESPLVQLTVGGKRTQFAKYLARRADDPGATRTFVTKTLVLLVEFGDAAWPAGSPAPTGPMTPGPLHAQIPAPAPDDNNTFWPGDSSLTHYRQMLFGNSYPLYDAAGLYRGSESHTMRTWYLEQSHGTFTVDGDIKNWVKLDMPESWYGADSTPWGLPGRDDLTGSSWRVARDAVAKFAVEHPDFPWAEYEQENPNGITGDDFNQPDGRIDHLIVVHAGSDQAAGGGAQGPDAIWSQSNSIDASPSGAPGGGPGYLIPGTEGTGPGGKGIWACTYTIDAEDGSPGVFCHEFGHDLGLPDEYDYAGGQTIEGSAFWTIMGMGAWLGRQWGLGSAPGPFNAWDKTALGFVTPHVVKRGASATVKLQPAATGAPGDTGVKIPLPRRKHIVELSGADGETEWYSGSGNDMDSRLTTKAPVKVPTGDAATLAFRTRYDFGEGHDCGYVCVSDDRGQTWTAAQCQGRTVEIGAGMYALSGADTGHWGTAISYDLSPWAGKSVLVQFRCVADKHNPPTGWEVTGIEVGGAALPETAFDSAGWTRIDGRNTVFSDNYYIAEYRTRDGADASLADCYEYNQAYGHWVDWLTYNEGLLLIYCDTFWSDNNEGAHPGEGGWLVVDARPDPDSVEYDGATGYWRPLVQLRDAAFSLSPTPTQSIYFTDWDTESPTVVGESIAPGKPAAAWFNDAWTYWLAQTPLVGAELPANLGVRLKVKSATSTGMTIWVDNVK